MKRILIAAMIVVLTLSACGNSQYDDGQADPGSGGRGSVDIISDFNRFAKEADNPSDVKERLDLFMENTDTEHSDILVREYLDYLAQVLASSKAYEKESMEKAGFKFISSEGLEQMVIDYHFMDAYSEKLSPEMIDFKEFMVLNSDQPWAVDGSLVITHSQLADRIVLGEKFLTSYPGSAVREPVQTQYRYYLRSFLAGVDNTPLVPNDTDTVDMEFIRAFEDFLENYPELISAESVKALLSELEANDYQVPYRYGDTDKKAAFHSRIDQLVDAAESKLGL